MRRLTEAQVQKGITKDLIRKVGDDVGAIIRRAISIAPAPHLPIAMAAGASAVAAVAILLNTDPRPEPDPDCLLLAGLLLGRTTSPDAIGEACKDFEILKAAGRSALAQSEEKK